MTRRKIGKLNLRQVVLLAAVIWAVAAQAQTISGTFEVVCITDRNATDVIHRKACHQGVQQITFGDDVTLAVEHAPLVTFDDETEPNPADLVLFLDGKPLPGVHPAVGLSQTDEDDVTTTLLTYHISRDLNSQAARKNWKEVLSAANSGRLLSISTGLENGPAARSRAAAVQFVTIRSGRLLGWALAALVGLAVFLVIAARTGALRDKEPGPADLKADQRAFSLSRVQMAVWTMLVIYAYLFIWILTGEYNATIPASVVGLMGIALATFGTAAGVDAAKAQTKREKIQKKQEELKAKKAAGLAQVEEKALVDDIAALDRQSTVCTTDHFYSDLSTSAQGVSLHRLQFMVWTLALIAVFVVTVWRTLAMPDFDATLLGLMGISSGAYAALKVPEEKS